MSDEFVALLVMIVFIALAALLLRQRSRVNVGDERGLPPELRGAEIAFAEKTFRSQRRQLVARLDRAYRTADGLPLVELKTRARDAVYMSDVIELSVQRIAVEDEAGESVSGEAWVVVQNSRSGTRRPHKVRLLGARRDHGNERTLQRHRARPGRAAESCSIDFAMRSVRAQGQMFGNLPGPWLNHSVECEWSGGTFFRSCSECHRSIRFKVGTLNAFAKLA